MTLKELKLLRMASRTDILHFT